MADIVAKGHKLVHLDLKGAPPKLGYLQQVLPLFSTWGATGLLVEYEDTFPYSGDLAHLQAPTAYSSDQIKELQDCAKHHNLIIIPLVPVFGHFEFVLKHDQHRSLREIDAYPNVLCPKNPNSLSVVKAIIQQVVELHPHISYIHIGADEVWHLGQCDVCKEEMSLKNYGLAELFLNYVIQVTLYIKEHYPHLSVIMWDDMLRGIEVHKLKEIHLGDLVQPMVWKYDATDFNLPIGLFDKYAEVFDNLWVASAFKGCTGSTQFLPPIQHHINNNHIWLTVLAKHGTKFKNFCGIILTGWQRYDHYSILCELLPVSLPSLALCLRLLISGTFSETDHKAVSDSLGFVKHINVSPFPRPQPIEQGMTFPGGPIYQGIQMWSNYVFKYQNICNSEGMLGWFSDYFSNRNFTNPVQVQGILSPTLEVHGNLLEIKSLLSTWMLEVFEQDTVDEWCGCFITPILEKVDRIVINCKKQLSVGGRVRDYDIDRNRSERSTNEMVTQPVINHLQPMNN